MDPFVKSGMMHTCKVNKTRSPGTIRKRLYVILIFLNMYMKLRYDITFKSNPYCNEKLFLFISRVSLSIPPVIFVITR